MSEFWEETVRERETNSLLHGKRIVSTRRLPNSGRLFGYRIGSDLPLDRAYIFLGRSMRNWFAIPTARTLEQ